MNVIYLISILSLIKLATGFIFKQPSLRNIDLSVRLTDALICKDFTQQTLSYSSYIRCSSPLSSLSMLAPHLIGQTTKTPAAIRHHTGPCQTLMPINQRTYPAHSRLLMGNDDNSLDQRGMKGYYTRPSRAIEKGGGFYIPGLEDQKIRWLSGLLIIIVTILNHLGVEDQYLQQTVSEFIGVTMAIYLIALTIPSSNSSDQNKSTYDMISILQSSTSQSSLMYSYEYIAREIVKTVESISYMICLDRNVVNVEIGPVAQIPISSTSISTLYESLNIYASNQDSLRELRINEAATLPGNIRSLLSYVALEEGSGVSIMKGHIDSIWVICSRNSKSLSESKSWIESLIKLGDVNVLTSS